RDRRRGARHPRRRRAPAGVLRVRRARAQGRVGAGALKTADRWIALGAPVVAMVTVGVGLELASRGGVRSALVYGAPPARGPGVLAWQVVPFEERNGLREPLARAEIEVQARAGGDGSSWRGETNADGVAEASIP